MKKFLGKKIISFVAFLMLFSLTVPVYANALSDTDKDLTDEEIYEMGIKELKKLGYTEEEIEQAYEDAEELSEYIEMGGVHGIKFDSEAALENGVDKTLVSEIQKDIDNAQLEMEKQNKGKLQCKGDTAYYGPQKMFMFDHCTTNGFIALLAGGAGLSSVVAAIVAVVVAPASIVYVAAAALMSFGATLLGLYDNGAGIYVMIRDTNRIGAQPNP